MTRFKNYKNSYSNDSRIFSMEDLLKMSMNEFFDRENEIDSQDNLIGLPTNNELKHSQNVRFVGSHIDKNGQTVPSRWEAYNPFKQMRLPRTPEEWEEFNKNITHNIKTHDFPELDEILRKALEKLRNSRQSVKPLSTDINETDQNFSDYFTDDENDGYDDEMETNDNLDNSLSKMINPISSLLSAGSLNNLFNNDEKIDDKLYDIEPQKTYKSVYSQNPIVENKRQEEQQDDNLKKYINELLNNNTTQEKEKSLKEHIEELNSQQIYPDGVIHAPLHGDTPTLTGYISNEPDPAELKQKKEKNITYWDKEGLLHTITPDGKEIVNNQSIVDKIRHQIQEKKYNLDSWLNNPSEDMNKIKKEIGLDVLTSPMGIGKTATTKLATKLAPFLGREISQNIAQGIGNGIAGGTTKGIFHGVEKDTGFFDTFFKDLFSEIKKGVLDGYTKGKLEQTANPNKNDYLEWLEKLLKFLKK